MMKQPARQDPPVSKGIALDDPAQRDVLLTRMPSQAVHSLLKGVTVVQIEVCSVLFLRFRVENI